MKRLVASCLLVISIVALSGMMPATSAAPRCQVAAAGGEGKSCSIFLPTGGKVNAIIVGIGVITASGPNTYGAVSCPQDNLSCLGVGFIAEAGTTITLWVSVGIGRVSTGLP